MLEGSGATLEWKTVGQTAVSQEVYCSSKMPSQGDFENCQAVSEPVLGVFLPFFVDGVLPIQPVGPTSERAGVLL